MSVIKHVLYIEDNKEFAKAFTKNASQYFIKVYHETNYEDMVSALKVLNNQIIAIILDIKCLLTKDQPTDNVDFLFKALSYLDQNYKELPRFIFTADSVEYESIRKYFKQEKVFKKTNKEATELLISIDALDSELVKIRNKYSEVFDVFNKGYLPCELEADIVEILRNIESNDRSKIISNLALLRRVQEGIFQQLNKMRSDILPDEIFEEFGNKQGSFWKIRKHLSGNEEKNSIGRREKTSKDYFDTLISEISACTYVVTSDNGSHIPYESPKYYPTRFTVNGIINLLFDQILWFNNIIENKIL